MKFLIRHLGNMGDHVFFIPPVLATLKRRYPNCHITLVTVWGYKDKRGRWVKRDPGGYNIHLIQTNPHVNQLIHWHDTKLSLEKTICHEDGQSFPTWNQAYYDRQKHSGAYDDVFELDFGLSHEDNPIHRMYKAIHLPTETYSNYAIHLTDRDREVAEEVVRQAPRPRVVLLEGLAGKTTRGWDPGKVPALEAAIKAKYGVAPIWFGQQYVPEYRASPLTMRQHIATLTLCDAAIGVMSGPLHFAAAVGLPTLTLYADQPLHRAAPAYFLNPHISDYHKKHRTLLGPDRQPFTFLKGDAPDRNLTPAETAAQNFRSWYNPGRQSTKSGLAAITASEVMTVLNDMLSV